MIKKKIQIEFHRQITHGIYTGKWIITDDAFVDNQVCGDHRILIENERTKLKQMGEVIAPYNDAVLTSESKLNFPNMI